MQTESLEDLSVDLKAIVKDLYFNKYLPRQNKITILQRWQVQLTGLAYASKSATNEQRETALAILEYVEDKLELLGGPKLRYQCNKELDKTCNLPFNCPHRQPHPKCTSCHGESCAQHPHQTVFCVPVI